MLTCHLTLYSNISKFSTLYTATFPLKLDSGAALSKNSIYIYAGPQFTDVGGRVININNPSPINISRAITVLVEPPATALNFFENYTLCVHAYPCQKFKCSAP